MEKRITQRQFILNALKIYRDLTASEAHRKFPYYSTTPITSIRRAISRLKKEDIVEDAGTQRKGIYSENETAWKLKDNQLKIKL